MAEYFSASDVETADKSTSSKRNLSAAFKMSVKTQSRAKYGMLVLVVVIIPYILLGILFWLYATVDTSKNNGTILTFPNSPTTSIASKSVVSFDSTGNVVSGAGRSVYKSVASITEYSTCYVNIDAVYNDKFLVYYQRNDYAASYFQVLQIDSTSKLTANVPSVCNDDYYSITTLNQNTGLFIGLTQSGTVAVGSVDSTSLLVTMGPTTSFGNVPYSFNPYLSRLSDNAFAVSFYNTTDVTTLQTQMGVVDPTSKKITFSPIVTYAGSAIGHNALHQIVGLSNLTYLLMYVNYVSDTNRSISAPLNAIKVTVDSASLALTLSTVYTAVDVSEETYQYFQAVKIDANTALVAYSDYATYGGMTCMIVETTQDDDVLVRFGSKHSVSTGQVESPKTVKGGTKPESMLFSLASLGYIEGSTNAGAMILYADAVNGAKFTAAVVEVTKAKEIVRSSPLFVLNKDSTLGGIGASGNAIRFISSLSSVTDSRIAMATVSSDTSNDVNYECNGAQSTIQISMFEMKAAASGIARSSSSAGSTVQLDGHMSGFSGLTPGVVYFADTNGNLLPSSIAYGRMGGYSVLDDYVETTSTITTLDALVGVAISADTIALGLK